MAGLIIKLCISLVMAPEKLPVHASPKLPENMLPRLTLRRELVRLIFTGLAQWPTWAFPSCPDQGRLAQYKVGGPRRAAL
jgi:hypothetical protein